GVREICASDRSQPGSTGSRAGACPRRLERATSVGGWKISDGCNGEFPLRWSMEGVGAARRCAEPLASIATQRLVAGDTLGEQQSFDPVDVLDPLDCQRLALTAKTAAVFVFRRRRPDYGADTRFAAFVRQKRAHQSPTVDPVGLRPPSAT